MSSRVSQWENFWQSMNDADVITLSSLGASPRPEYGIVLFAQACLETGYFTSGKSAPGHRNYFGMRTAVGRKQWWCLCDNVTFNGSHPKEYVGKVAVTPAQRDVINQTKPDNRPFAMYFLYNDKDVLSLIDRISWDTYNGIYYNTAGEYMDQVLGNNKNKLSYCPEKDYKAKWVQTLHKVQKELGMTLTNVTDYSNDVVDTGNGNTNTGTSSNPGTATGSKKKISNEALALAAVGAIIFMTD